MDTNKHIATHWDCFLADLNAIDWESPLSSFHGSNSEILRKLAGDKPLMKRLILGALEDPYLWSKCEEDINEDKIVLWDDVEKGMRIRLRMSTQPQQRLAHSHRFTFTNLVMRGSYTHWHYDRLPSFDEKTRLDDVKTSAQHVDREGDTFSIHHEALHSTPFPENGTVSLVLRGNPIKERAPVMFKEARGRTDALADLRNNEIEPEHAQKGDFFWRVGEDRESTSRRAERQMTQEKLDFWVKELEKFGLL